MKRQAVKQSSGDLLPVTQMVDKIGPLPCMVNPLPSMFNLGLLCDELSTLLQPMRHKYFGMGLIHQFRKYRKDLDEMGRANAEEFVHCMMANAPSQVLGAEIITILSTYVSCLDRGLIQLISGDLARELKIIQDQIVKRKALAHYAHGVKHPSLEEDLIIKILVDSGLALESLEADKKLVVAAQQKLKPFLPLLRRTRNPYIQLAGIGLVSVFMKQGFPKPTSIELAYGFLKGFTQQNGPSSLHSFHVSINRLLH